MANVVVGALVVFAILGAIGILRNDKKNGSGCCGCSSAGTCGKTSCGAKKTER